MNIKKPFSLVSEKFIGVDRLKAEKHRYLGTLADPIKEFDYFSKPFSLTMFGMILCEIAAHYGVPEKFSACKGEMMGPRTFRISLSLKETNRLSMVHLQNFHAGIEKMLNALAREDDDGKLAVNPYEMWIEAADKLSFFNVLKSMMLTSEKNLTTPDLVNTELGDEADPDYEWTDERNIEMSEEQHESLKNAQNLERLQKYARNYKQNIKGYSTSKEIEDASSEAESFLALPSKSYTRIQFEAAMSLYRASGLSISMEHVLKTIYLEDCGTKPIGVDITAMNGGFH